MNSVRKTILATVSFLRISSVGLNTVIYSQYFDPVEFYVERYVLASTRSPSRRHPIDSTMCDVDNSDEDYEYDGEQNHSTFVEKRYPLHDCCEFNEVDELKVS